MIAKTQAFMRQALCAIVWEKAKKMLGQLPEQAI